METEKKVTQEPQDQNDEQNVENTELDSEPEDSQEAEQTSEEELDMRSEDIQDEFDKCCQSLKESKRTVQECERTHGDIKRAFNNQIIRDLSCPQLFNGDKTWRQLKPWEIYRRAQQMEADFYDLEHLSRTFIPKTFNRFNRYGRQKQIKVSKPFRVYKTTPKPRGNFLNTSYHEQLQPKFRIEDDLLGGYDLSTSLPVLGIGEEMMPFLGTESLNDTDLSADRSNEACHINQVDNEGKTSLHYAAKYGRIGTVSSLLKLGAFVNAEDDDGKSALTYAVEQGFTAIAKDLISKGAFVNQKDFEKKTPLHKAADDGRKMMVDLLLEHGASVFSLDNQLKAPLHYAADKNHLSVVESLINYGAPINQSDGDQRKPLHYAADKGYITQVELLLRRGASIDSLDKYVRTPLFLAVQRGFEYVVHTLIRFRAAVNCTDRARQTPLHIATEKGIMSIATDLIRSKARLDCRDELGRTPIIVGIESKELNLVDILLRHGANVDITDNKGRTALCCAVDTNDNDIIYMISKHGLRASPSSSDVYIRQLQLATERDCDFLGRTVWNHVIEKFTNFPGGTAGYRNLRSTLQTLLEITSTSFASTNKEQLWKAVPEFRDDRLDKPLIVAYVFLMPNERKPMYMGVPVVYRMHEEAQKVADQEVSFSTTKLSGTSTPKR